MNSVIYSHCAICTVISTNTRSKSYVLSLTGYAWEFTDNALWDINYQCLISPLAHSYQLTCSVPPLQYTGITANIIRQL